MVRDSDDFGAYAGGRLTIDLDAIVANYRLVARRVAPAISGAVVKADAYGLGAARVSPALYAAGCRHFFVVHLEEALRLKPVLPDDAVLYVLNGLVEGAEADCADAGVWPVLNSLEQAWRWRDLAVARNARLSAVVQLDSGMSRLGLSQTEVEALAADPAFFSQTRIELVMSHLACADTPENPANAAQLARFNAMADLLPPTPRSFANSGGAFAGPLFQADIVRPGICLYGVGPITGAPNPMTPVVTLEARVIQLRTIPAGVGVGYGLTFTAPDARRLATISVGYADGWPRRLGGVGAAWFQGVRLPIVGRVSMDSITLDVTALAEGALKAGDFVQMIGPDQPLEAVAADADTIAYEILTSLGHRYQRLYLSQGGLASSDGNP